VEFLTFERLYKSLSLLLARQTRLKVPPSLLLLTPRNELVSTFADEFGYPLMIRMDYRGRPKTKPVGGIPLYELNTINRVCKHLLGSGCLPLLHPNFDRFKDVFSSGLLLSHESDLAEVEIVGRGFDAGDLRLGRTIPHETIGLDLATGRSKRCRVISIEAYTRERSARDTMVRRLLAYTNFANRSGKLLHDLSDLDLADFPLKSKINIPPRYERISDELVRELLEIARAIKIAVLPGLPPSKAYVASVSYLVGEGWVLWDIYGEWYQR